MSQVGRLPYVWTCMGSPLITGSLSGPAYALALSTMSPQECALMVRVREATKMFRISCSTEVLTMEIHYGEVRIQLQN